MIRSILYPTVISLLLAVTPALGGKLYRWVDEEGNVHYTDKIPPSQVRHEHHELSGEGVRMRTVPEAKSDAEIAREKELARLRAEQQRLIEKQQAEDRVLLRTFRSEDDLLLTRDGKLQSIDVMIKLTQGNIRRHQAKLSDLQRRAATMERTGRQVPDNLLQSIESTNRSIEEGYASIVSREEEKEAIRQVFARDRKRLRELKHLTPESSIVESRPAPELLNIFACENKAACDAAWSRAEGFVRRHATTPIQMLGDNIVMSKPPQEDQDISITISRIRDKERGDTSLFMDLHCKESSRGKEFCAGEQVEAVRQSFRKEMAE